MSSTAGAPRGVIPAGLLRGHKALVTGANSGIGKATAIGLGRAGADVVVNHVADADEAGKVVEETPQARTDLLRLIPYERVGEPEDIAQAAVALASDLMDHVVGTTLCVDGGMTLYPGFSTGG